MRQKIFSILALLIMMVQGTWAENVTFNRRSWDDTNKKVVTTSVTKDATVIEGSHPDDWLVIGSGDDQNDHFYVVKGDVSYQTLYVFGKAHLILADGATLTLTAV